VPLVLPPIRQNARATSRSRAPTAQLSRARSIVKGASRRLPPDMTSVFQVGHEEVPAGARTWRLANPVIKRELGHPVRARLRGEIQRCAARERSGPSAREEINNVASRAVKSAGSRPACDTNLSATSFSALCLLSRLVSLLAAPLRDRLKTHSDLRVARRDATSASRLEPERSDGLTRDFHSENRGIRRKTGRKDPHFGA